MSSTIHRRVHNTPNRSLDGSEEQSNVRRQLAYKIIRAEEEEPSCLGNAWKFVASLLLTAMLLGPLLYTSYQKTLSSSTREESDVDIPDFLLQADQLSCAKNLNITFSQLFMDVKLNNLNPCRTTPPSETGDCTCQNPTIPQPRLEREQWLATFERNQELVSHAAPVVDVVLTGDSITEHWMGTSMAEPSTTFFAEKDELWHDLGFDTHALALGISGDRIPHLLYRMQNGELPDSLTAKSWWILIGTNDYRLDDCAKEAVLAGNLAILDEGLRRRPDSRFIVNSLLPVGEEVLSIDTTWQDYTWINERLECLAELDAAVSFFNGTKYFLTDDGTQVNQTLMYDYVHPSTEAYRTWGESIRAVLQQLGIWTE